MPTPINLEDKLNEFDTTWSPHTIAVFKRPADVVDDQGRRRVRVASPRRHHGNLFLLLRGAPRPLPRPDPTS